MSFIIRYMIVATSRVLQLTTASTTVVWKYLLLYPFYSVDKNNVLFSKVMFVGLLNVLIVAWIFYLCNHNLT